MELELVKRHFSNRLSFKWIPSKLYENIAMGECRLLLFLAIGHKFYKIYGTLKF